MILISKTKVKSIPTSRWVKEVGTVRLQPGPKDKNIIEKGAYRGAGLREVVVEFAVGKVEEGLKRELVEHGVINKQAPKRHHLLDFFFGNKSKQPEGKTVEINGKKVLLTEKQIAKNLEGTKERDETIPEAKYHRADVDISALGKVGSTTTGNHFAQGSRPPAGFARNYQQVSAGNILGKVGGTTTETAGSHQSTTGFAQIDQGASVGFVGDLKDKPTGDTSSYNSLKGQKPIGFKGV